MKILSIIPLKSSSTTADTILVLKTSRDHVRFIRGECGSLLSCSHSNARVSVHLNVHARAFHEMLQGWSTIYYGLCRVPFSSISEQNWLKSLQIGGKGLHCTGIAQSQVTRSWCYFETLVKWQLLASSLRRGWAHKRPQHKRITTRIQMIYPLIVACSFLNFHQKGTPLFLLPLIRTSSLVSLLESTNR